MSYDNFAAIDRRPGDLRRRGAELGHQLKAGEPSKASRHARKPPLAEERELESRLGVPIGDEQFHGDGGPGPDSPHPSIATSLIAGLVTVLCTGEVPE